MNENLKDKTILELAMRLNEIIKEQNELDMKSIVLEQEYNEIVYELWERIPRLTEDENLQPMARKRRKNYGKNV